MMLSRSAEAFLTNHVPFWIVLLCGRTAGHGTIRAIRLSQNSVFTLRPLWNNFLSEIHAVAYAVLLFFIPWKLEHRP